MQLKIMTISMTLADIAAEHLQYIFVCGANAHPMRNTLLASDQL